MESYKHLCELVESVRDDVEKASEKGNKAAGTRVRKAMQEIKKTAQQVRAEVLNLRGPETAGKA